MYVVLVCFTSVFCESTDIGIVLAALFGHASVYVPPAVKRILNDFTVQRYVERVRIWE